jgi:hypothetical protein
MSAQIRPARHENQQVSQPPVFQTTDRVTSQGQITLGGLEHHLSLAVFQRKRQAAT